MRYRLRELQATGPTFGFVTASVLLPPFTHSLTHPKVPPVYTRANTHPRNGSNVVQGDAPAGASTGLRLVLEAYAHRQEECS